MENNLNKSIWNNPVKEGQHFTLKLLLRFFFLFLQIDESLSSIFQRFMRQIFSPRSQLISLDLDISNATYYVHECLQQYSHSLSNTNSHQFYFYCTTLRYLKIYIAHEIFLDDLISFVPNLEEISINFRDSLCPRFPFNPVELATKLSNQDWFSKVRTILKRVRTVTEWLCSSVV